MTNMGTVLRGRNSAAFLSFSCCAQCATVELFNSSVTAKTKVKGLLDILASAAEYNELPLRHRYGKTGCFTLERTR